MRYLSYNGAIHHETAQVGEGICRDAPIFVGEHVEVFPDAVIGRYTIVNKRTTIGSQVRIGRFCSIGRDCEIGPNEHPVDFLSTHPFQCTNDHYGHLPDYAGVAKVPHTWNRPTVIGNDVWIGAKAGVRTGVTIGDGAVIGAGALVTRDLPPYSIATGIPARVRRRRFDPEIIAGLLEVRWWDLELADLADLPFDDVGTCLARLREIRTRRPG